MAHLAKTILALAAIASVALTIGAHILALQGVTYVSMFSEYQKTMSTEEAFELTFSGREICGICVAVDQIQVDLDQTLQDFSQQYSPVILLLAPFTQSLSIGQTGKHVKWTCPDRCRRRRAFARVDGRVPWKLAHAPALAKGMRPIGELSGLRKTGIHAGG